MDDNSLVYNGWYDLDELSGDLNLYQGSVATGSNYDYREDLKNIDNRISDIYDLIAPDPEYNDSDAAIFSAPLMESIVSGTSYPDNVIVYRGRFNGSEHLLFLPYEFYDKVSVIDGYLYNLSNSNIYGRFDVVDGNSYLVDDYYLTPILGSPSNLYTYGSYNYSRDYYVNNGRISYNTVYGNFEVLEVVHTRSVNNTYKVHLDLLVLIVLLGVMILCYWKKLRH